jgi:leader peptidase (prepilin peptidase)/N-methyltransferase
LEVIGYFGKLAFKKEAMGFGDVKLMGAVGAFFGWQAAVFTIMLAAFIGSISGVVLIATKRGKLGTAIPFGPYLAMAAAIWVFWGPRIVQGYMAMLKFPAMQ